MLLVIIISFLNCEQEEVIVQQENNALKETLLKAKKINEKSPKDFGGDIKNWAEWLDENDTNIGVIDTIYDFKFKQLTFINDVIIHGVNGGKIINTAPIKFSKSLYLENFSIEFTKDIGSNPNRYGNAFEGYNQEGSINVFISNVNSSYNRKFLHIDNDDLIVNLKVNGGLHKSNGIGVIFVSAITNNAIIDDLTIKNPIGFENTFLDITDANYMNSGSDYIIEQPETYQYNFYGILVGSKINYSERITISNNHFENLVLGRDSKTFASNNDGRRSTHMNSLLVIGNNSRVYNNYFKECEVGFYVRGNYGVITNNVVENNQYTSDLMFLVKSVNSKAMTYLIGNKFIGKSFQVGLVDSYDTFLFKTNTFDIKPIDVKYKKKDESFITRNTTIGIKGSSNFRENGGSVIFDDNKIEINGTKENRTYVFLAFHGNISNRLNSNIIFKNNDFYADKNSFIIHAFNLKSILLLNNKVYGKVFYAENLNKVVLSGITPLIKNGSKFIFNTVYLKNVEQFYFNGNEIETEPNDVLNRINLVFY